MEGIDRFSFFVAVGDTVLDWYFSSRISYKYKRVSQPLLRSFREESPNSENLSAEVIRTASDMNLDGLEVQYK